MFIYDVPTSVHKSNVIIIIINFNYNDLKLYVLVIFRFLILQLFALLGTLYFEYKYLLLKLLEYS